MRDSSVKSEGGGEGCSAPLDEPGNSVAAVFNNFLISSMSGGCECFQVVSTTGICSEEEEEEEACDSSHSQVPGSSGHRAVQGGAGRVLPPDPSSPRLHER